MLVIGRCGCWLLYPLHVVKAEAGSFGRFELHLLRLHYPIRAKPAKNGSDTVFVEDVAQGGSSGRQ
jgi:hypothetical protein